MPMTRLFLIACLAFFAAWLPASGDTRSVYTITGIEVDERAPSVIEAQQNALAEARRLGAEMLIAKITLPEDRAAAGGIYISPELAQRLAAAVDVEEETRGGGRYIGVLSVVLNPRAVRTYLEEQDIPYLDAQAPMALVVPVGNGVEDMAWAAAWPERDDSQLAPYVTSDAAAPFAGAGWIDLADEIGARGASRGVIARLVGSEGTYRVDLTVITPAGRLPLGQTRLATSLEDAVAAASERLSETWKRDAMVRSDQRTIVTASVLYTSIVEWNTLRAALARSPLVSQFRTDAIARDGALVRFAFAGDVRRLENDLRQRGVALDIDASGWVLTSAVVGGGS